MLAVAALQDPYRSIEEVERDFAPFLPTSPGQHPPLQASTLASPPSKAEMSSTSATFSVGASATTSSTTSSPSASTSAPVVSPTSQGTWSAGGDFDWGQRSAASSTANSGASTRHHQHSYHHYPPSHHQHVFNHDQQHHQPMGGAGIHLGSDPYGQHTGVIKQEASGRSTPPVPIPSSYYGPPYALPHASLEQDSSPLSLSLPYSHLRPRTTDSRSVAEGRPDNSRWELSDHDGMTTAVSFYPSTLNPLSGVTPPSALAFSSLPSFTTPELSSIVPTPSSELSSSEGHTHSTVSQAEGAEEAKREWKDEEEESSDDDDSEGSQREDRDTAAIKASSKVSGFRSRKRSAGDLAAAKKKKVALERERRKELTNFFYRLQSCVPSLRSAPTRPTKAILLQSACEYIQALEAEIAQLRSENQTLRGSSGFKSATTTSSSAPTMYPSRAYASSSTFGPLTSFMWSSAPQHPQLPLRHPTEYSMETHAHDVVDETSPSVPTTLSTGGSSDLSPTSASERSASFSSYQSRHS